MPTHQKHDWTWEDTGKYPPRPLRGKQPLMRPLLSRFCHVQLFATPWTEAHQAPLSVGFSRQEYWSGLPFPSNSHLLHLLHWQAASLPLSATWEASGWGQNTSCFKQGLKNIGDFNTVMSEVQLLRSWSRQIFKKAENQQTQVRGVDSF